MARWFGFAALLAVAAWAALVALDVVPMPPFLGGGSRDATRAGDEETLGADGEGAAAGRLAGRGRAAGESGSAPPEAPAVPAEARGTAEAGGGIRGRVVREPGPFPVEGARVLLRRPDSILRYLRGSPAGRYDLLEARTGRDGRFAFLGLLPAEGYVVRASLPTGPTASSGDVDLRGRLTKDVGDLVLGASGALEGRVVDAAGRPVADARVAVSWEVRNDLDIVLADPDTLEEIEGEARTGEDGTFAVAGLEPGSKTVIVATASAGADVLHGLAVAAGPPTRVGDVVLAGTKALAGRVEWEDGRGIEGARVFAAVMGQSAVRTAESAADGAFRLERVPEGTYRIGVLVPGLSAKVTQEEHAAGADDVVVRIPVVGAIEGRVVEQAGGAPVRRFAVRVEGGTANLVEQLVRRMMERKLGGQPVTDPEGRFRIERAYPGKSRVVVTAEGYPETRSDLFDVVSSQTAAGIEVRLPAGNGARGVVLLPDGSPAAGAKLYVATVKESLVEEDDDSRFEFVIDRQADAVADAEGRFVLPPQTPGRYDVTAIAEDRLPGTAAVDLTRPFEGTLEIRLPPCGRVEGRVLDDAGRPAPGAPVVVYLGSGGYEAYDADADGRFRSTPLPPGAVVVRWRSLVEHAQWSRVAHGQEEASQRAAYEEMRRLGGEVHVPAGGVVEVTVRMPRLVRWTGRLRSAAPTSPHGEGGVFVVLRDGGPGGGRWIPAGEGGRFSALLEPGVYEVYAPDADGDWVPTELTVPAGGDLDLDVVR